MLVIQVKVWTLYFYSLGASVSQDDGHDFVKGLLTVDPDQRHSE